MSWSMGEGEARKLQISNRNLNTNLNANELAFGSVLLLIGQEKTQPKPSFENYCRNVKDGQKAATWEEQKWLLKQSKWMSV